MNENMKTDSKRKQYIRRQQRRIFPWKWVMIMMLLIVVCVAVLASGEISHLLSGENDQS